MYFKINWAEIVFFVVFYQNVFCVLVVPTSLSDFFLVVQVPSQSSQPLVIFLVIDT